MCQHMKAAQRAAKRIASGLDKKQKRREISKWVKEIKAALKGDK